MSNVNQLQKKEHQPTVSSSNPTKTMLLGPADLRKVKKLERASDSKIHSTLSTCFTRTEGRKRKVDVPSSLVNMTYEQDKVNNADSAFIFLISRNQWSVGQGGEDGLVFARKIARMILIQNI